MNQKQSISEIKNNSYKSLLTYSYSSKHKLLALEELNSKKNYIFYISPPDANVLNEVSRVYGPISLKKITQNDYDQLFDSSFISKNIESLSLGQENEISKLIEELPKTEDVMEFAESAPIINIVNKLFSDAVNSNASDIHIEPYFDYSSIRYRIDGKLKDILSPPKGIHSALISRIKIMSKLDITESRLPQDGKISLKISNKNYDVRVSTLPNAYGERAVLRILNKNDNFLSIEQIGMNLNDLSTFKKLIKRPNGLILVTGPTGSGKTTTLYSAINELNNTSNNILTVEDPVEYDLPGIGQTQINTKIDMTFANALRSMLRQDPDIIMIGEIRDNETAQIAIQAALTGHLVFATLHTNNAISSINRLLDMKVEPYLLASTLLTVISQRLIRKICGNCKNDEPALSSCENCKKTGFKGRTAVYELLKINPELKELIHNKSDEKKIYKAAIENDFKKMMDNANDLIEKKIISKQELIALTRSIEY